MMETEQRMLKGFVTAGSLSSEDIDAVDKSVSGLRCSASDPGGKELTLLMCHCRRPTVRAEEEGTACGTRRMDSYQRIATGLAR